MTPRLALRRTPPAPNCRAFTVVELMVTVIVMGIMGTLLYVGHASTEQRRRGAEAEAATSAALLAEQQLASEYQSYSQFPSDLQLAGVNVTLSTDGISHSTQEVSVAVGTQGSVAVAVRVSDGLCRVVRAAPMALGGAQSLVDVDPVAPCRASEGFAAPETVATQVSALRGA